MLVSLVLIFLYLLSFLFAILSNRSNKRILKRAKSFFLICVLFVHTILIIIRTVQAGRLPLTDTYETLLIFSYLVILIGLIIDFRYKFFRIRLIAALSACFILLLSVFISPDIHPLMPSLRSGWIFFHVVAYFIAYAAFSLGFGISLFYIIFYLFKKENPKRQLLMQAMEGLIFRIIDIGFPFLTIGIAAGAVWANISWGRFWSWDAKEVWALATWLIYSGCLHLRHSRNLNGIYAASISALGFIAIIFTYIGVNLFFPSIHSYS